MSAIRRLGARWFVWSAVVWALALGSCTPKFEEEERALAAAPEPVGAKKDVKVAPPPIPKTEKTRGCCWCPETENGESGLYIYTSADQCETVDPVLGRGKGCRRIEVLGGECSFQSITHDGNSVNCEMTSLWYVENGKKQELKRPTGILNPCEATTVTATSTTVLDEDTPDPNDPDRVWCLCGRDTSQSGYCALSRTDKGVTKVIERAQRPAEADGCTREVCVRLFNASYGLKCPEVYQGAK